MKITFTYDELNKAWGYHDPSTYLRWFNTPLTFCESKGIWGGHNAEEHEDYISVDIYTYLDHFLTIKFVEEYKKAVWDIFTEDYWGTGNRKYHKASFETEDAAQCYADVCEVIKKTDLDKEIKQFGYQYKCLLLSNQDVDDHKHRIYEYEPAQSYKRSIEKKYGLYLSQRILEALFQLDSLAVDIDSYFNTKESNLDELEWVENALNWLKVFDLIKPYYLAYMVVGESMPEDTIGEQRKALFDKSINLWFGIESTRERMWDNIIYSYDTVDDEVRERAKQYRNNAFDRWAAEDEDHLWRLYQEGKKIDQISNIMQRSNDAIIIKLGKLLEEYKETNNTPRN